MNDTTFQLSIKRIQIAYFPILYNILLLWTVPHNKESVHKNVNNEFTTVRAWSRVVVGALLANRKNDHLYRCG